MRKLFATIFIFGGLFISQAQNMNDYKYIIIPESFEFLGDVNQYKLNSLTKFLFEREGFNTVMRNEPKPQDLANNGCLGLNANVENNSGIFVTKLVLKLKDCNGKVVFTSDEGRSREKEFEKAYHEALRDAFNDVEALDYVYVPKAESKTENTVKTASVSFSVDTVNAAADTDNSQILEDEEEALAEPVVTDNDLSYSYNGKSYSLNKTSQGYALYQEGSTEPIAILVESAGGKSFIYNSLTRNGVGYFDADKNLIVEFFNPQENKKVSVKYQFVN